MLKLAVGVPAYRGIVAAAQAQMWMEFGASCARAKDRGDLLVNMIATVDVCGVERARNLLVNNALRTGADWLLMVDSDTWAQPGGDLLRMILEAGHETALVGAPVVTRRSGGPRLVNLYAWNEHARIHEHVQPEGDSFMEVDAIGAAAIAINLRRIGILRFEWKYGPGVMMSEDLYFCRRLRESGERILADVRIATRHTAMAEVLEYKP